MNTKIPYNDHIHLPNLKELKIITPNVSQSKFISGELSGFISINGDYLGEDDEIRSFSHPIPFAIYLDEECESPYLDIIEFKYESIPKYGIEVMIKTNILGIEKPEEVEYEKIELTTNDNEKIDETSKSNILDEIDIIVDVEQQLSKMKPDVEIKSPKKVDDTSVDFLKTLNEELSEVISKSRPKEVYYEEVFRDTEDELEVKNNIMNKNDYHKDENEKENITKNAKELKLESTSEINDVEIFEDERCVEDKSKDLEEAQLLLAHNQTDDIDIHVTENEEVTSYDNNRSVNFEAENSEKEQVINLNEEKYVTYKVHQVKALETLEDIAREYGVEIEEIKKANYSLDVIDESRKIFIPYWE